MKVYKTLIVPVSLFDFSTIALGQSHKKNIHRRDCYSDVVVDILKTLSLASGCHSDAVVDILKTFPFWLYDAIPML
jgi:hypothetical protein